MSLATGLRVELKRSPAPDVELAKIEKAAGQFRGLAGILLAQS